MKKAETEKLYDQLGVSERIETDNILKWDGEKLYITEEVFRAENKICDRMRDVTKEVAECLSRPGK